MKKKDLMTEFYQDKIAESKGLIKTYNKWIKILKGKIKDYKKQLREGKKFANEQ